VVEQLARFGIFAPGKLRGGPLLRPHGDGDHSERHRERAGEKDLCVKRFGHGVVSSTDFDALSSEQVTRSSGDRAIG
jgi:hypothetical protein